MAGLDEGYLKCVLQPSTTDNSLTSYMKTHDMTAADVVAQLRAQVEERTGLTISAGIAPNRMLAKVSDHRTHRHLTNADLFGQEQA